MTNEFPLSVFQRSTLNNEQQHLDWLARLGFTLTISRIPATALTVLLLLSHRVSFACWVVAVAVLVDIFDGVVFDLSSSATKRDVRQRRRVLDAVVDRVFIWTTLGVSLNAIRFPVVVYSIIMAREILLSIVCGYPYLATRFVQAANLPSRIGTALIAAQFIVFAITRHMPSSLPFLFSAVSISGLAWYILHPKRV